MSYGHYLFPFFIQAVFIGAALLATACSLQRKGRANREIFRHIFYCCLKSTAYKNIAQAASSPQLRTAPLCAYYLFNSSGLLKKTA